MGYHKRQLIKHVQNIESLDNSGTSLLHFHTEKIRKILRVYVQMCIRRGLILKAEERKIQTLKAMVECREEFYIYYDDRRLL